jgi:hypothetical protein
MSQTPRSKPKVEKNESQKKQNRAEQNRNGRSLHLSNALINPCLRRQLGQLLRCKLQHTNVALLGRHVGLSESDLLLRGNSASLNLREEL